MKRFKTIAAFAFTCFAHSLMSMTLPTNIQNYLERGSLTEDGIFTGDEAEQLAFINHVKANWSTMLDNIDTVASTARQQTLIIAAAESLPGRDYIQFTNKLCDQRAAGKVNQSAFEQAISGITPKKHGFLPYNYQDNQVRQLVQRFQGMFAPSHEIQSFLSEVLSGEALSAAEFGVKGQGLPEPERLAPQP